MVFIQRVSSPIRFPVSLQKNIRLELTSQWGTCNAYHSSQPERKRFIPIQMCSLHSLNTCIILGREFLFQFLRFELHSWVDAAELSSQAEVFQRERDRKDKHRLIVASARLNDEVLNLFKF